MRRLIKRPVKSLIWYRNKRRIVKTVAIEFRIGGVGGTKRNNFKYVVQYKVKRYQKLHSLMQQDEPQHVT